MYITSLKMHCLIHAAVGIIYLQLYKACVAGDVDSVQKIIPYGVDVNEYYEYDGQKTPLYAAALNDHEAVVEILLKAGADVNKKSQDLMNNYTPLHIAALMGYHDVITVLLSYNADGTIKDKKQKTAAELMVEKYKQQITEVFTKKAKKSVAELSLQLQKSLPPAELKLIVAEKRASIAEERAITAEKRAIVAEEKATIAENSASVATKASSDTEEESALHAEELRVASELRMASESRATLYEEMALSAEKRAASAEEKATAAELRAIAAEGREIALKQRGTTAEKNCAILKQILSDAWIQATASSNHSKAMEKRTIAAEKRASISEERANAAGRQASVAEARAIMAENRASVAEERIQIAEMEIIAAKKKTTDANSKLKTMEERTLQAEYTIKTLQERVLVSDGKIAGLVQMNTALEGRAKTAEQQVSELTMECRLLQKELNEAKVPSWVVKKEDVVLTDKEIGRGAYGTVKAAGFCGLDVVAKFLHKDITSPYYQQQFKREMDISAQIRHPNIVLFIGATLAEDYIILTELMHTSLRAVLEGKQSKGLTMTHQQISSIATDVGKALNYLHMWKPDAIIHRDVSSSNVLLESLGADMWKAKVSDFGSSNFARQVRTMAPGCPAYAAPECGDPKKQSPKMDVFSYGVLLLEILYVRFPDIKNREALISKLSWSVMKALIKDCTAAEPQLRPNMAGILKRLAVNDADMRRPL